ncbi:MAG: hypothetical protein AAF997_16445 [Myxococcota bacterium]
MNATSSPAAARIPSRRASIVFGVLDLLTAAAVVGFMSILWSSSSFWPIALGIWAVLLVGSAIGLFSGSAAGRVVARLASFYQLGFLAAVVVGVLSSVSYLWGIYGQIGIGVSVALLAILALLFEIMGLLPVFKLRALGLSERVSKDTAAKVGGAVLALLVVGTLAHCVSVHASASLPSWEPIPAPARQAMSSYLMAVTDGAERPELPEALGNSDDRWLVRVFRRGRVRARHEVTGNLREATEAAAAELEGGRFLNLPDRAIAVDRIVAENDIPGLEGVLGALSIIPGLDGVSGEVDGERITVAPQELVLRRMLSEYVPIPFIRDFEIGADPDAVRELLCTTASQPADCEVRALRRARSESWVHENGKTRALYRSRPVAERPMTPDDARAGAVASGHYVLRSLKRDGRFQYQFFPQSGRGEMQPYNIPRHAGTTWFLLELYEATGKQEFLAGAETGLDWLEGLMTDCGDGLRCIGDSDRVGLGPQALPLIAFATHAKLTGDERYGDTVAALAEVVSRMQRDDGDFNFELDRTTGTPVDIGKRLYAGGQAILGLALAGQVTGSEQQLDAARRGLDYMAGPYWDFFMSDLFFIEEHWTCLAANEVHRLFGDRAHAELCLAAAGFDRQLQHGTESVFPDYVGGIGFTPFFPPYTTTAAGRGEGLIAAYRISERLGEPDPDLFEGIEQAVGFLVHNQYKRGDTYAFRTPWSAVGAMPWNYYDPTVRIDTVQHSGSVMLHGSDILEKANQD